MRRGGGLMLAAACAAALVLACSPSVKSMDFGATMNLSDPGDEQKHDVPTDFQDEDMESLLHWAIENSDPEELARQADKVRTHAMVDELKATLEEQRVRVRELRQFMESGVSETQMIQELVAVLSSTNSSEEERLEALRELQPLVEPIDNANDLKPLGGLTPVVEQLSVAHGVRDTGDGGKEPAATVQDAVRAAAAWVLGTAASNNIQFQADVLEAHPSLFEQLVELCLSDNEEVAAKGLYAAAAMARNTQLGHAAFAAAAGYDALGTILESDSRAGARLKRKALSLAMDLSALGGVPAESQHGLLDATVSLLTDGDLDTAEKALGVLASLLQQRQGDGRGSGGTALLGLAQRLAAAGAAAQLDSLATQLAQMQRSGGDDDDDDGEYVAFLVVQCTEVQAMLSRALEGGSAAAAAGGASSDTGKRTGSRGSSSGTRKTQEEGSASQQGNDEPILSLGHQEL